MSSVLNVKNSQTNEWMPVLAIKGDKGNSGVYCGEDQPDNTYDVWVKPSGGEAAPKIPTKVSELENDASYTTKQYVKDAIYTALGVIENGTY